LSVRLEWTEPALADLEALRDYIAQDSPVNAVRFIERLFKTADKLVDHPRLGREVAEADDTSEEIREQIFSGYRILYRVLSDRVQVIAVVDSARDLAGAKNKPWNQGPVQGGK